jgi:hypothetical protein
MGVAVGLSEKEDPVAISVGDPLTRVPTTPRDAVNYAAAIEEYSFLME